MTVDPVDPKYKHTTIMNDDSDEVCHCDSDNLACLKYLAGTGNYNSLTDQIYDSWEEMLLTADGWEKEYGTVRPDGQNRYLVNICENIPDTAPARLSKYDRLTKGNYCPLFFVPASGNEENIKDYPIIYTRSGNQLVNRCITNTDRENGANPCKASKDAIILPDAPEGEDNYVDRPSLNLRAEIRTKLNTFSSTELEPCPHPGVRPPPECINLDGTVSIRPSPPAPPPPPVPPPESHHAGGGPDLWEEGRGRLAGGL